MAKTFYKYGERDAIQYTDWSEISKNFSTMISDELTRREDKKAEIQKGVDETMKFINDNPIGDFDVANDFSLSHAKNAQEYLLMTDKLLKAGKIRPQDFVRMRENLKTGTEGIYEVANAYQKRYQEVMDDINSGDPQLSNLVYSQMTSLEGIGKLKNTDAIIDTSSGRVNLSKYDVADDGVKNYTEAYTTNELKAFLQSDIKRFDVKGVAKEAADSLGGLTESYVAEAQRAGGIHILRESVNRYDSSELKGVKEGYQKWLDDTVDSYMSDVQQASILVDFLQGKGYKAVTDRRKFDEDKTGKLLYIRPNGQLEFQDGQKELAKNTLKNQIHYSIERKYSEKMAGYKPYPKATTSTGKATAGFGNYWMKVASESSLEDKQAALDAAIKSNQAIKADIVGANIIETDTGFQIQVSKKNSQDNYTIDIPRVVDAEQWAGFGGQMVKDIDIQKMIAANKDWTFIDSGFGNLESVTRGEQLQRMTDQEVYDTYAPLPREVTVKDKVATYDGVEYDMSDKVDVRKVFNLMIDNNPTLFEDIDVDAKTVRDNFIFIEGYVTNEDGKRVRKTDYVDIRTLDLNNIESEFSEIIFDMLGSQDAATRAEKMRMRSETEFLPLEPKSATEIYTGGY